MVKTNTLPGIPQPQLPLWADSGVGSLSQSFLNKRGAKPIKASGGWLGEFPNNNPAAGPGDPVTMNFDGLKTQPLEARSPGFGYGTPTPNFAARVTPDYGAGTPPPSSGIDWAGAAKIGQGLIPFASNIANSFRKVPQPIPGSQISPVSFQKVNNSNELAAIDQQTRASDLAVDRNLSGNAGAAVRTGNLAGKLRAYGDSYSRTANTNAGIYNQQEQFNSGIEDRNARVRDEYNDKTISARIAQQRASSENLSNASDKFVQLQNAKAQRELDAQKWTDASRLFNKGVVSRYQDYLANPSKVGQELEDKRTKDEQAEEEDLYPKKKRMGGTLAPARMKKAYA